MIASSFSRPLHSGTHVCPAKIAKVFDPATRHVKKFNHSEYIKVPNLIIDSFNGTVSRCVLNVKSYLHLQIHKTC